MKIILKILTTLVSILFVAAGTVTIFYFVVKNNYGIDLIATYNQMKLLNEPVDEESTYKNKFGNEDLEEMKTSINASLGDVVTYEEGKGFNGYVVDFSKFNGVITSSLMLNEKTTGAMLQSALYNQTNGQIEFGNTKVGMELIEVNFLNIDKDSNVDFNATIKLDLTSLVSTLTDFPLNLIKGMIPNYVYASSTVTVTKGNDGFEYSVSSKELTLNKLDDKNSEELINTFNKILKTGKKEDLNILIGGALVDGLIGNETTKGFAYSLKEIGAKSYSFMIKEGVYYFCVNK